MTRIGILAYGSLIDNPGEEMQPMIVERIKSVQTTFSIEFARRSSTRDGAPTLVPVAQGGSSVTAEVLVLKEGTTIKQARDVLWRREANKVGSEQEYSPPENPTENTILVEDLTEFAGIDVVLYTKIGANIKELNPDKLADLAIASAKATAGELARDGVSYLMGVKRAGISTPLMTAYEKALLNKTGTSCLRDAWLWCRTEGNSSN